MTRADDRLVITVAAVGPTGAYIYALPGVVLPEDVPTFVDQGLEIAYRDRAKVEVLATRATTLGEVLSTAARDFGFPGNEGLPFGVAFYTARDDEEGLG